MKLTPILLATLLIAGCHTVAHEDSPRFVPIAEQTTEQLWDTSHWDAAAHELVCQGMTRRAAEGLLVRRYAARESRIATRLGEKNAREIVAIGRPPCRYFRGSMGQYAELLRELERRLSDQ